MSTVGHLSLRFNEIWRDLSCSQKDAPGTLWLSIGAGAYFFLLLVFLFMGGGVQEADEFAIYILGWVAIPALSLVFAWAVIRVGRRWFSEKQYLLPLWMLINALAWLVFITSIDLAWQISRSFIYTYYVIALVLVMFPLVNLAALYVIKAKDGWLTARFGETAIRWTYAALPILLMFSLFNFSGVFPYTAGYQTPLSKILIAVPLGLLSVFLYQISNWHAKRSYWIDFCVVILLLLTCFDPLLSIAVEHQNFYLGPINAILRGRTVLVDVFSQYGVLLLYFLALPFRIHLLPLSYQGLSVLIAALYWGQYVLLYALARMLTGKQGLAILVSAFLLLVNLFATIDSAQAYPSIGPARFGLSYLFLAVFYLRGRYPRLRSIGLITEALIIGCASIWSFETFTYVIAPVIGLYFYEVLLAKHNTGHVWPTLWQRLLGFGLGVLSFHLGLALFSWLRSGSWPNWSLYFSFIQAYSLDEFGTLPIAAWSPWLLIAGVYFASLMYFIFQIIFLKRLEISLESRLALGMVLTGIVQMTYFIGRSHPNNLLHISVPAILLVSYWISRIGEPRGIYRINFRSTALFAVYTIAAAVVLVNSPRAVEKYPNTGFSFIQKVVVDAVNGDKPIADALQEEHQLLWEKKASNKQVATALRLIGKYTPAGSPVILVIRPDDTTQALILSNRFHVFPIGHPVQDAVSPKLGDQIVSYPYTPGMKDLLVLASNPAEMLIFPEHLYQIQLKVVKELCRRFDLREINRTDQGVSLFRLMPKQSNPSEYCTKVQQAILELIPAVQQ